LDVVEVGYLKP